jgi:hypothetical protein
VQEVVKGTPQISSTERSIGGRYDNITTRSVLCNRAWAWPTIPQSRTSVRDRLPSWASPNVRSVRLSGATRPGREADQNGSGHCVCCGSTQRACPRTFGPPTVRNVPKHRLGGAFEGLAVTRHRAGAGVRSVRYARNRDNANLGV